MKRFSRRDALLAALLAFLLASVLATGPVAADPAPRIMARAHLEPAGPVVAGSEVKLVVDLLTTTWFTEAPNWPLFTVADAIVNLPDEQADNLSEDIGGTRWFGVSRAYRIAPQAGKTYEIAPLTITVYPGGMQGPAQVSTPALKFVATLPPGAEGMTTFFAVPRLTVEQKIEPAPGHLAVGAPLTRTITQRAAGTESMLIPPAILADVAGLKRYARPAVTRNIVEDRAGLVAGERTDSASYVADRSGTFSLPPLTIEWWNTAARRKETIVLPAVHFSAAAVREKPLFDIPLDAMREGMPHRIVVIHAREAIAGCLVVLGVILLISWRARVAFFVRRGERALGEVRTRWLASDARAWRKLAAAARKGEWRRTIAALYSWMDRGRDFGHPARFENIETAGDQDAARLIAAVESNYAGGNARGPGWKEISAVLRRSADRAGAKRADETLPRPLNPFREPTE
ncbi:oxygen tolerance family protein [Paraburkholderia xenovorans LB400]|uniref:Exported protein n=1 Tax=Paraburkholderia xenovorans (strain LB400) TaxID=266265 RepID=Q13YL1_PARXL|nr:BatD family protein [Paraburkholderia xenovorans]ABE30828.1 Putative exported protein [Paraburkholderia xenovorans LB400]AIP31604.1 oxygen tolerance family protein [Paraburkholderia xenovorans LB400]